MGGHARVDGKLSAGPHRGTGFFQRCSVSQFFEVMSAGTLQQRGIVSICLGETDILREKPTVYSQHLNIALASCNAVRDQGAWNRAGVLLSPSLQKCRSKKHGPISSATERSLIWPAAGFTNSMIAFSSEAVRMPSAEALKNTGLIALLIHGLRALKFAAEAKNPGVGFTLAITLLVDLKRLEM